MRFSCLGDIGSGSVTVRQHSNVEKPDHDVTIQLTEPVALTFSLKYLGNFCKASGLSAKVRLCLSQEVPLLVEYPLAGNSYLRFYLAPKVWLIMLIYLSVESVNKWVLMGMLYRLATRNEHDDDKVDQNVPVWAENKRLWCAQDSITCPVVMVEKL